MAPAAAAPTSQDVAALYRSMRNSPAGLERALPQLTLALTLFVSANEDPSVSTNYASAEVDPVDAFIELLMWATPRQDATVVLLLLKCLKVLSRKQPNRLAIASGSGAGLRAILTAMSPPLTSRIAAESANVLLNCCYEAQAVGALLRSSGPRQLLGFLAEDDPDVQANAAGALQSISFQAEGRGVILHLEGIPALLPLLASPVLKVVARAAGAIHNLSSEGRAIRVLRENGGIPPLVDLLTHRDTGVAGAVAGALQNVSREVASRLLIRELDAVPALASLLSAGDMQAQVCAAGALLNILGPDMENWPEGPAQRSALGKIVSLLLASSVVYESVYDVRPGMV